MKENDKKWPKPNSVGRQELEVTVDGKTMIFSTSKFGSFGEV